MKEAKLTCYMIVLSKMLNQMDGCQRRKFTTKGLKGTFWHDGNVIQIGVSYETMHLLKLVELYTLKG